MIAATLRRSLDNPDQRKEFDWEVYFQPIVTTRHCEIDPMIATISYLWICWESP